MASWFYKGGSKVSHSCSHHLADGHDIVGCVSLVPIFNHLPVEQMDEIRQVVQSVSFEKGEIMYHAGDRSDSLYIVNKGKIKIYRLSESGKEQMVRILQPGDFTGELALFQQGVHEAYAEAIESSQICRINSADLQNLLLNYPTISLKILTEFANRLDSAEKQTTNVVTEKVETRIAMYLVDCIQGENSKGNTIYLPMRKKDLASYLGTTPETLSRRLREFEDAGFIRQEGQRKINILDPDALLLI